MKRAGDHMLLSMGIPRARCGGGVLALGKAAIFVACFGAFVACANDFDALTAGPSRNDEPDDTKKDPTTTSGGTTSGAPPPAEAVVPTDCKDPDACNVQCSKGELCNGSCTSAVCSFEVTGATGKFSCNSSDCTLQCNASSCVLDCLDSDSCEVTCDAKSSCVVNNCGDACSVSCGGGRALDCGDKTQACGACPP